MPNDDIPDPTPELILWANFMETALSMLSHKDKLRFLATFDARFEEKTGPENVTRIRPGSKDEELRLAIRQARAWYRRCLPVFLESELHPAERPAKSVKKLLDRA